MNRKKVLGLPKKIYVTTTGYSYTNLGRLFLRLFVGIMLLQFGIRQIAYASVLADTFPSVLWLGSECSLWTMIVIEVVCSVFIMAGFLTRIMLLPPFIAMCVAAYYLIHDVATQASYQLSWENPAYLPIMFLGIFFFLMLVGPGKISIDYFLSLHLLHSSDHSEDELEEV
ncbi:MAG: DoxX family protein [Muribaculaceae bacterium]|nr:DoxX family protein [Muribaculaceae bacterium]